MSIQSKKRIKILPIIILLIMIGEGVFGGIYFKKYTDLKRESAKTVEQKNKELVDKVSKVYQLPSGEEPVILNVNKDPKDFTTDQEKAFAATFKDLKKGDIILLYEKAAVAVEYRPSEGKVISTASLAVSTNATNVALIATPETQATLTGTLNNKLASEIKIGGKATPTGQYTSTTVVDLTGKKSELAKKIADTLGATVANAVPDGEQKPDGAEIVIIAANASAQ